MTDFTFDDHGELRQLAANLTRASAAVQVKAARVTHTHGIMLQTQVKANAAGRPGPRIQTSDYNRSINLRVGRDGGAFVAEVGTNRPQGRRLEFGFVGTDSLGRVFDQPPYPHFGPALDTIAPKYEQALADLAGEVDL